MNSIPIVNALLTANQRTGRHPQLTWYGHDGRIELSGDVLTNWINKTTNLLVEDIAIDPGETVRIDLPPHWRTLVWQCATLLAGGALDFTPPAHQPPHLARVIATNRPDEIAAVSPQSEIYAVSLAPLARTFGAPLPPHVIDAGPAVMGNSDALGYVPPIAPNSPALYTSSTTITHEGLHDWVNGTLSAPHTPPARRYLAVSPDTTTLDVLRSALQTWLNGGSIVLTDPVTTAELHADPVRKERILTSENVTA